MVMKNILALVPALVIGSLAQAQPRFYDDDPLWVEERVDVIDQPSPIELSDLYDRLRHTFGDPGDSESGEAVNVNTVDEVPNSAWFTKGPSQRRCSRSTAGSPAAISENCRETATVAATERPRHQAVKAPNVHVQTLPTDQ